MPKSFVERFVENCNSCYFLPSQAIEKNGGDDGTRTRGLCRDRAAF
jgi:hypothetical protein